MADRWNDTAVDARHADPQEVALQSAVEAAELIVREFPGLSHKSSSGPHASYSLESSSRDKPLFVFTLKFDVGEDLDAANWPRAEVEDSKSALRERIIASAVDNWDWLVTVGAKGALPGPHDRS